MPCQIAGSAREAMLAVVVADVEVEGDWQFDRRQFGAMPSQLRLLTYSARVHGVCSMPSPTARPIVPRSPPSAVPVCMPPGTAMRYPRGLNGRASLYRRLLAMTLTELDLLESHMLQLEEELAALLRVHQAAVQRLAAVPGFGVDSAQQIIAKVGPAATTFPTASA